MADRDLCTTQDIAVYPTLRLYKVRPLCCFSQPSLCMFPHLPQFWCFALFPRSAYIVVCRLFCMNATNVTRCSLALM